MFLRKILLRFLLFIFSVKINNSSCTPLKQNINVSTYVTMESPPTSTFASSTEKKNGEKLWSLVTNEGAAALRILLSKSHSPQPLATWLGQHKQTLSSLKHKVLYNQRKHKVLYNQRNCARVGSSLRWLDALRILFNTNDPRRCISSKFRGTSSTIPTWHFLSLPVLF